MPSVLSQRLRRDLGMTVAVWFAPDTAPETALGFLRQTLDDAELFVDPQNVVLVVDGCPGAVDPVLRAAEEMQERCGSSPRVDVQEQNLGQGGAVARGLEVLLDTTEAQYLCTRDVDGDHDLYDLPQLARRLEQLRDSEGQEGVFVVGSRADRHRPMGYARGELEELLNEVTVQTLTALGSPPDLRHCRLYEGYADFQSGYKVYTRQTAQEAAQALRVADATEPSEEVLRWGVQFISTVELLRQGAVPASVNRLTYDQQPQTTFEGHDDLPRAFGRQLAWLFRHLQVRPELAWPILDTALAGTLLATVPGGSETLLNLREYVAQHTWRQSAPRPWPRGMMF
ncbi:hypothetical protein LLH03_04025 [bacterium]|nr:hypothetical protein [bacterium]